MENYLTAKKAKALSVKVRKSQSFSISDFETRNVLNEVKKTAEYGMHSVSVFEDDNVRENLKLLGYEVSDMWAQKGFYQSEMMTVSWE